MELRISSPEKWIEKDLGSFHRGFVGRMSQRKLRMWLPGNHDKGKGYRPGEVVWRSHKMGLQPM